MLIRCNDLGTLERAAVQANVNLYNLRPNTRGRGWRFQLHANRDPETGKVMWGRRGFSRNKDGSRRRAIASVCWHGHRAFMLSVLNLEPKAVIVTALARYDGLEGFLANFPATYYREAGSVMDPVFYGQLCDCDPQDAPESDVADGIYPGTGQPVSPEGYCHW